METYNIMILDSEASAAALREHLQSSGFQSVDIASDPLEALSMFRNKKYHIFLADMDLPAMGGIDILKQVKHYDPLTQVVMMTSGSTIDRALTCLELGASDYVLKPFKDDDVVPGIVKDAVKKLERWKEAIRETVFRQNQSQNQVTE